VATLLRAARSKQDEAALYKRASEARDSADFGNRLVELMCVGHFNAARLLFENHRGFNKQDPFHKEIDEELYKVVRLLDRAENTNSATENRLTIQMFNSEKQDRASKL
jgi:hypothetical protein